MTEVEAVDAIQQRFITAWEAEMPLDDLGNVAYTFEGEGFEAPANWARVTVLHASARQTSAGGTGTRRFERRGNVFVQLFTDVELGRRAASRLADVARTVFEAQRVSVAGDDEPIVLYAGQTREVETEGRWVRTTVSFPFTYYQTR